MVSKWLDMTPIPDLPLLKLDELLDVWSANRNSTLGVMAADEIAKREFSAQVARQLERIKKDPDKSKM